MISQNLHIKLKQRIEKHLTDIQKNNNEVINWFQILNWPFLWHEYEC